MGVRVCPSPEPVALGKLTKRCAWARTSDSSFLARCRLTLNSSSRVWGSLPGGLGNPQTPARARSKESSKRPSPGEERVGKMRGELEENLREGRTQEKVPFLSLCYGPVYHPTGPSKPLMRWKLPEDTIWHICMTERQVPFPQCRHSLTQSPLTPLAKCLFQ